MQLNISLPAEIETALRRRAAAAGQDVDTFVARVVTDELTDEIESAVTRPKYRSHEEFKAKLDEIIQRHNVRNGNFDDSRESIYAGRGE
jgi:hypothetical protein